VPFSRILPLTFCQARRDGDSGMVSSSVSMADIEPRSYSNIPVGLNFLLAGYTYQRGNVAFAPTIPINNAKLETSSAFLAYVRSLDIWGKSGKVDIIIPEAWLSGQAEVLGNRRAEMSLVLPIPWFVYMLIFSEPLPCR